MLKSHFTSVPAVCFQPEEVRPNYDTRALLSLASCVPVRATVHGDMWSNMVTPLRWMEWEKHLASHLDREFADYVVDGIRGGFRVGFSYREATCKPCRENMRSVKDHAEVVEKYLGMEQEVKRLLGPLERIHYPHVQIGSFGVIPKSEPGKWWLILDLSSPSGNSVNNGINKEWCSLSYMSVDDVAARVVRLGRGALMAKFDLKSAYRNIPVHPDDRWLLGMEWQGQLFVDTALPFGLRSALMIFNAVAASEALAYIIRQRGVKELDHYLDDFSLVGPPKSSQCARDLDASLQSCDELGCPVAGEKTEGPAFVITLLGVELDSDQLQLRLPTPKLEKLRDLVATWRRRKACTKRELQSLAGHLCHAGKVIRPGRRFLRGLFGLLSQFRKQDHIIRLNAAF